MKNKTKSLNKKEILDKLKEFEIGINEQADVLTLLEEERIEWCKKNRESIKALYPEKGKIYQLKDPFVIFKTPDDMYRYGNHRKCGSRPGGCPDDHYNDIYFIKITSTIFSPHKNFYYSRIEKNKHKPIVRGEALDSDLNVIEMYTGVYSELCEYVVEIYITDIIEIEEELKLELFNDWTKVYIMIDKNTGYYKIGRSKKPKYREKTLQSEKPTIEMLFNYKGTHEDETYLHNHFKAKKIRGEWFDLNGSNLNEIKMYFNNKEIN